MKAKSTIPKKGKRLESPEVEPSKQPVAQVEKEDLGIDLEELSELSAVNDTLEKLFRTDPSAMECEDEGNKAYKRACALLTYADLAAKGWEVDCSVPDGQMAAYVMDSIRLQLDIVRLAGKRLFSMCRDHNCGWSACSPNS